MKVVVIGIDCANLDLILQWKSELPNLRKLIEEGIYGKLESTMPPATSPAWNCLFTGKNPGKIGIYDLIVYPFNKEKGFKIVNYTYQDSPSLWDILGNYGKKVGVINVPTTFPPNRVNGFMVSGGLLTPLYSDTNYTYPHELKEELNKVADGYEILPFTDLTIPRREKEYLKKFDQNIDKQLKAVKYLMRKYPWDFMTYVFFVTDSVQHYCWHHMDETHPWFKAEEATKWRGAIKEVYRKVDSAIGEIIAEVPEETNTLIVSDHGSGPCYGYLLVNEWLKEKGFLKLKSKGFHFSTLNKPLILLKNFISSHVSPDLLESLVRRIPAAVLSLFLAREQEKIESIHLIENIDWSRTQAYGLGGDGSIFINLKGREPEGIVEPKDYEKLRGQIAELLHQLKKPNGESLTVKVFRKEEIYKGKHLYAAPDLLFILDDYKYQQRPAIGHGSIWKEPASSGGHSLYGTLIAGGPDINKANEEIRQAKIYDIAPTVLHMFGLPVPKDMDGRVLKEIFGEGSEPARREISYQEVGEKRRIKQKVKELFRKRSEPDKKGNRKVQEEPNYPTLSIRRRNESSIGDRP